MRRSFKIFSQTREANLQGQSYYALVGGAATSNYDIYIHIIDSMLVAMSRLQIARPARHKFFRTT
jgi:hypothetical protein